MNTYKSVLVATDLTQNSQKVGDRAVVIAANANAVLSIVHVMEEKLAVYGRGEFGLALVCQLEVNVDEKLMSQLSLQAESLNIPESRQWVLQGSCKDGIVQLAKHINADLIVVGSHDRHGLSVLFNSTTDAILHAMPCDVLAVKVPHE